MMTAVCFVSGNFREHATRRNRQIWTNISPKTTKHLKKILVKALRLVSVQRSKCVGLISVLTKTNFQHPALAKLQLLTEGFGFWGFDIIYSAIHANVQSAT